MINKRVRAGILASAAAAAVAGAVVGSVGPAGASTSGSTESFLITGSGSDAHVVAHGAFTAGGVDVSRNSSDKLQFGNGRLIIKHPSSEGTFTFHLDPTTCFVTVKGMGSYTLANGTGAYAGVTGSGTYKFTDKSILAKKADGSCDFAAEPTHDAFYVKGSGPVSLGDQG